MLRSRTLAPLSLLGVLALTACGGSGGDSSGARLQGAGATFPAPIYLRWFQDLAAKGSVKVNYQSVGSGAGIRQFDAATVDFAASDKPLSEADAAAVKRDLKLSQQQLVSIFEGKITNYSDLGCGDQAIKVVYRSDGSGTTYNFTKSLSAFSPAWASGPGSGKSIKWPTGLGAKGNEGMAASLQQIKGALGYVESSYVRGDLQAAALQNAGGSYAKPTTKEASEALGSIDLGPNLTGSNPNPKAGYPIVTFTWILLYKSGNGDKLKSLQQAFNYTLSDAAQANAPALGYVSLPANVLQKARAAVASIGE
jgi:phosphate transport system substrate-binding protein